MDFDSDRTVDSDELENFIHSQKKNECNSSKETKSKIAVKSTKPHSVNYMSDSDSSERVVKKKKLNVSIRDSDTDRTVDSDELEEFITRSQKEKSSPKVGLIKAHQSKYKEISDSDDEIVKMKKVSDSISSKRAQSSYKEISDSDSDSVVKKQKVNKNITRKKPQSNHKEISDSDKVVKNKKGAENISSKPQSCYKEISDSDSVVKKQKVSKNTSSKKPQSIHKEILDSDSNEVVKKKKVAENISSKKPQSSYKEISDSDSDSVVKKQKVSKNTSNKKLQSSYKEISDSDSDEVVKKKVSKNISSKKREKCKYGKYCYRKNPDHIKNFDHGEDINKLEDLKVARQNKNVEINPTSTQKPPMCQNGKEYIGKKESQRKELDLEGDGIKSQNKEKPGSSKEKSSPSKTHASTSGCKNYHFYLTKVNGIPSKYNCLAYDIKDLLSSKDEMLISSAQFNYVFDIPWLIQQYPEKYRKCPLSIVHGEQRQSKKALEVACAAFPNIKLCQAKLDIPYGTHHTKMMFLLYKEGFKIVIHTSNIVDSDWDQRTQGMWISPLLPALKNPSTTEGESPTNFKADLLEYVTAYGAPGLDEWLQVIKKHDFSTVRVVLIGSVPGRHLGSKKTSFGHLKLRKVLNLHGSSKDTVSSAWHTICQFSSIGSLGSSPDQWMTSELSTSLSTVKDASLSCQSSNLKLVFPTVENVRKSLQGYPAGVSLPYSIKVAQKQTYLKKFMHQWKSDKLGRSEASPHIKTYLRVSPDNCNIAWFLLTSANLSKAAWGALEKKGTQLMIRSYELGVLFLPKFYGLDMFSAPFSIKNDFRKMFPVPYDIPLEPYSKNDEPWIWDIPHIRAPDRFGQMWCPP